MLRAMLRDATVSILIEALRDAHRWVVCLKQQLEAEGFRIPIRIDGGGRSTGGGLFSRGHVYKLLSNAIYVGRIAHKGQVHEGQHEPIVSHKTYGTRSSKAWAIISALRGLRERANHPMRYS